MPSFVDAYKEFLLKEKRIFGGTQYLFKFPNNYGASVVRHNYSYGFNDMLWELAVTKFDDKGNYWHLCYDTYLTDDVIGSLEEKEVSDLLGKIKSLGGEKVSDGESVNDRQLVYKDDAERLLAERDARIAQLERERDEARSHLRSVVSEVEDLIDESHGVYGLHLNGDPAPWDEIVTGGRFERIASVNTAREYIDAAMKGGE